MTHIYRVLVVLALLFGYLFFSAGFASLIAWLTQEDEDMFFMCCWISGALLFITVALYLMNKLGMWG